MRELSAISYQLKARSAQLLVEAMVAITIILVGLLGVISLLSSSLGLNKVVTDQYVGVYLASEGIEVIRGIVDNEFKRETPVATTYPKLKTTCLKGCIVEYNTADTDELSTLNPSAGADRRIYFDGTFYGHNAGGVTTPFSRLVYVDTFDVSGDGIVDGLTVRSEVEWLGRGGGKFSVKLADVFYDWR